tara:strand:- start:571 stop:1470 length:900 start_codon:yes stop_codon:yes gene_type:complete
MRILITGANGMVGQYLKKLLPEAKTPNSKELDLTNSAHVINYFEKNKFDYVIHLAAHVGSLHDNIENRTDYFNSNILMNTLVTKYAFESGVKNFLGILSTCIYPNDIKLFPIKEDQLHLGAPHPSLMSYSYAKRSHAVQLDAYKEQFGVNYNYLIPCNLYGIVNESHEKRSHFVNDLIFKVIDSQKNESDHITLFGDGTPMRQFMHASDLAKIIHLFVVSKINTSFNVAPDINMSIEDIALSAIEVCDNSNKLKIKYDSSKPNGQHRKDVDTTIFKNQIKDFKFKTLTQGIKEIYAHYK